jgi:hypothetical protein
MTRLLPFVALALLVATTSLTAAEPRYSGYWKGEGTNWERLLDDGIRRMTRRSQTTFWAECVRDTLRCKGEATTVYSVDLDGIKWTIPLPTGGSTEAEVSGSSEKSEFTFPIEGVVVGEALELRAVGEDDKLNVPNATFEFVITAHVTLPGAGAAPAARPSRQVIRFDAKGWSPFQKRAAAISKRASGQYVAKSRSAGEGKYLTEWRAEHSTGRDLDYYHDCMDVAAETANEWDDFCRRLPRRERRQTCWRLGNAPPSERQGWCERQWGE